MSSQPGRPANKGSFTPGNQAALGNDKTADISVFFKKALKEAKTLEEYEEARSQAEAMATDFVHSYWDAKNISEKKAVLDTIMDRTEGKAQQKVDHTTLGKELPTPLLAGIVDVQRNDSTPETE